MYLKNLFLLGFYISLRKGKAVKLDEVNCGVDGTDTVEGTVSYNQYPWVGMLYYTLYNSLGETRSVTTVVLIHVEFVLANSADIGPMPKQSFREKARVLLGEDWGKEGRRVRTYVMHPEYGKIINSVAVIQLGQPVRNFGPIRPVCPPPEQVRYPKFWVVKFDEENLKTLKKRVLPVVEVSNDSCRDFYVGKSLYDKKRQPSFVKCTVSLETRTPCVWGAGAALVTRDVWGRWQLLGLGTYGPGCGAPARFLDMLRYYLWIKETLEKFQLITISRIHPHKYVLRSGIVLGSMMRFGDCEDYEKQNIIYRDYVRLASGYSNMHSFQYNMTIYETVLYTCLIMQLKGGSANALLELRHFCPRKKGGGACHQHKGLRFAISVDVTFFKACALEIVAYGVQFNMSLIDLATWKHEEGTYYEDFRLTPVEYRGPSHMTQYGFEPLDDSMLQYMNYDMRSTTTPHTSTSYFQICFDDIGDRALESLTHDLRSVLVPLDIGPIAVTSRVNQGNLTRYYYYEITDHEYRKVEKIIEEAYCQMDLACWKRSFKRVI